MQVSGCLLGIPTLGYGHPRQETLTTLRTAGVQSYGTAEYGTVVFAIGGETTTVKTVKSGNTAANAMNGNSAGGSGGGTQYIGNTNTKVIHLPSCGSLPHPEKRVDSIHGKRR